MANLPKEICFRIKEARKAKGMNQSSLAQAVGCRQSAISMFEAGMASKLSEETVRKIGELLGVELNPAVMDSTEQDVSEVPDEYGSLNKTRGYCPNCSCPSNVPYVVDGRLLYRPSRSLASPLGGSRCAQCGDVLEMVCPSCGALLNDGACCCRCGNPYVASVVPKGIDIQAYAYERCVEIERFKSLW